MICLTTGNNAPATAKLQLSDPQRAQIEAINSKYREVMESNHSAGGDRIAAKEQMKSIRDQQNQEFKVILTDAQLQYLWPRKGSNAI